MRAHLPSFRSTRRGAAAVVLALVALASGCDKASHDSVDKWMNTEKGPAKLKAALAASDLDPDLRAHAGHNLVLMDRFVEVKDVVESLSESERGKVMAALSARLIETAKFKPGQDATSAPSPAQSMAKDALFDLRDQASPETRGKIDEALVEWLAGGYYEGRAREGRIPGRLIIRAAGAMAAPKLLESARSIIARPADPDGSRVKIGDELLTALALTGQPDAIGFVLDLATGDFKDDTLGIRATAALWQALVQPPAGVEPLDARTALLPHLDKLLAMVRNERLPGEMINDAADLVAAIGPPECLKPFLDMVSFPHSIENYRWIGTQKGVRCGGVDAIVPLVEAVPTAAAYERGRLEKYVWREILAINAKTKVAEAARALLGSKSWVARVSGIELLGALALKDEAAEDAKKIRGLAGDRTVLKGWWGKQGEKDKKKDPTLGQVAGEVAAKLEGVAKGSEIK